MKRRIIKYLLLLLAVFGVYLLFLHHKITSKFEYHRWNLPSRVYSDSYPLYPGRSITAKEVQSKLDHLGYRPVSDSPEAHGEYRRQSSSYQIFLHRFDFPGESFEGYPISFDLSQGRIARLVRSDTNQPLRHVRLEPELIASVFDQEMEDRTFVAFKDVPENLIQAVITTEDERYYSHFGIDPIGIARAFLVNIKSGRIVQGGSTLTQQLVKNFFLHSRKSFIRKINEMLMAILMELRYSKEEILEAYLNEIYLGQRGAASIAGVQEAVRYYFSKDVEQLGIAESALLAGMIRSPGYYSPYRHPKRAIERRNFVLKKLLKREIISKENYEKSRAQSLPLHREKKRKSNAPYFVQYVQKQLHENFPADKLQSEGLQIFTTLEMNAQRIAEKALTQWIDKMEKDYPFLAKEVKEGNLLEGAFVALQPQTGFIRAYVGGRDYGRVQLDHVSQINRQPGSAFKPFVYLTALDPDLHTPPYTLASIVEDTPFKVPAGGEKWSPKNYDKKYHGSVRLRVALEKSYNVSTSRVALDVGLDKIIQTARSAGISSPLKPYPSISLGSFEVSPLELASAYTIFPNQGVATRPISITKIVTPEGEILEQKEIEMKQVFDADAIYLMNKLMEGVIERGTARQARARGLRVLAAGKTGTTSDYRDAWFVGYTPELLALAWVGYDDNRKTNLSGSRAALPIWTEFMKGMTAGRQYKDFPPTSQIVVVSVDQRTGLRSRNGCGPAIDEYFIEGTEPTESCVSEFRNR